MGIKMQKKPIEEVWDQPEVVFKHWMYYAQQKVDRAIKSHSVASYDTLPSEPEINVAGSTSQEPAKLSSKSDPKEVKEQKKKDQEKAWMQKEIKQEERPNENCLKLRRLTLQSVFARKLLLWSCCLIKKCGHFFLHFRLILHIKFIISKSVDMIYDIKYYHLCIHTGL